MANFDASRMLSFDLETTSANPLEARIVTSALITIDGRNTEKLEMLADPGIEIPEEAAKVHGITTEKAREEGRPHEEVLDETVRRIKDGWEKGFTLVVFNAAYDLSVLLKLTNGDFTVTGPVYDPYVVDRLKDPYRKGKRNLTDMSEHYSVPLDNAHEATADALAAARIAWKQVNKMWPDIKELDTGELMEVQAVGYHDMQVSLRKYFESRGKGVDDVNTSWPMHG